MVAVHDKAHVRLSVRGPLYAAPDQMSIPFNKLPWSESLSEPEMEPKRNFMLTDFEAVEAAAAEKRKELFYDKNLKTIFHY